MTSPSHVVIVYQFGKVASTALVRSLNQCEGVEAHQSHFLGDDALQRIVVNATSPTTSPYFRKHMKGQLMMNLDLTHRMKRLQQGRDSEKLTILSLSREPLDWFRSSVQQDIGAHAPHLAALAGGDPEDGAAVAEGVARMLIRLVELIETNGGPGHVVEQMLSEESRAFLNQSGAETAFLKQMFAQALRPLLWFEDHFRKCFNIGLGDFTVEEGYWIRPGAPTGFVLLRYEDIATGFAPAMRAIGVPFEGEVVRANQSATKRFAAELRGAFDSPQAARFGALLRASDYARFFAYDEPAQALA